MVALYKTRNEQRKRYSFIYVAPLYFLHLFLVIIFHVIPQKVMKMSCINSLDLLSVCSCRAKLKRAGWGEPFGICKHFLNASVLPKQTHSFCAQTESYGVGQAEGINAVSI